jgi:peptidoglycan-associated lipoprotein
MKKIFSTMFALSVVALLVLGGCSSTQTTDTQTPGEDKTTVASDVKVEELDGAKGGKGKRGANGEEVTPPEQGEGKGGNSEIPGTLNAINFEFDRSAITAAAKAVLDGNYDYLTKYGTVKVLLVGHCDERGSDEYNIALGERRADVAKNYLVNRGIDADRMEIMSKGENEPLDDGHTEAAWAKNRRAQFLLK